MERSEKKEVENRAYRLVVPYSDTVDMAKRYLCSIMVILWLWVRTKV